MSFGRLLAALSLAVLLPSIANAAERRETALFISGNTRDFSTGIPDDA